LKQERTRHVNRVHKLLEETNIKLSSVFADLMCKTEERLRPLQATIQRLDAITGVSQNSR